MNTRIQNTPPAADDEREYERRMRGNKPGSLLYIWRRMRRDPFAMAGLFVVTALLILSFFSPYIMKYEYTAFNMTKRYMTPSLEHPLGNDELGRDILSRVVYGAKYTMSIGIASTAVSCVFGVILGAVSGYYGGWVDGLMMRFLDVFQSFPNILLAIAMATVLGRGFEKIILAMGISGIPGFARMMRASILTVRGSEYIEAAISINCSTRQVVMQHVIPNAISPLIIQVAMGIASAGLQASSLSFLGFGVQAPTPEWGSMLSTARQFIRDYPHMVIIPGLFIMLTVLSFNLIGDAVRDALDPKLRD